MVKKITISVPDELHEKMERWKDSFNFSGVFQRTISEAIQKKEDFQKRLKGGFNMETTVKRFKKEKSESEDPRFEKGKKEGLKWAKSAHYDDLQFALQWNPEPGDDPRKLPRKGMEHLEDYFEEIIKKDSLMGFKDYDNLANEYIDKLVQGWKEAVEEFWNQVKDKI